MDNKEKLKPSEDQKYLMFFLFTALFIVLFLVISGILINQFVKDRGTYGDMFGMTNALFSGLAFAGIIVTILMQRKELQLQRLDLELTREELKKSTKAQENISKLNALSAKLVGYNNLMEHYQKIYDKTFDSQFPKSNAKRLTEIYKYRDLCGATLDEINKLQDEIEKTKASS